MQDFSDRRGFLRDPRIHGQLQQMLGRRVPGAPAPNQPGMDNNRAQQATSAFAGRQTFAPRNPPMNRNRNLGWLMQRFLRSRPNEQPVGAFKPSATKMPMLLSDAQKYQQPGYQQPGGQPMGQVWTANNQKSADQMAAFKAANPGMFNNQTSGSEGWTMPAPERIPEEYQQPERWGSEPGGSGWLELNKPRPTFGSLEQMPAPARIPETYTSQAPTGAFTNTNNMMSTFLNRRSR